MQLSYNLHGAENKRQADFTFSALQSTEMPATERDGVRETFKEINQLIGLREVKNFLYEVHAYTTVQQWRQKEQLKSEPTVLHAIFSGNPGSGKTTVARLMAKLYHEMGVLSKGHLVEVERADLVGEFIGHTAQRTREQIKKSLGGVMFIDEAYSLIRGGEKDFGREAIDALVKGMEDHKNDFILILAGYSKEMHQFLQTNPGLRSRFPLHIDFPDYTGEELLHIAKLMLKTRQYSLSETAIKETERCIMRLRAITPSASFGNARSVRNLIEAAIRMQAVRLTAEQQGIPVSRNLLCTIESDDISRAAGRLEHEQKIKHNNPGELIYMNSL